MSGGTATTGLGQRSRALPFEYPLPLGPGGGLRCGNAAAHARWIGAARVAALATVRECVLGQCADVPLERAARDAAAAADLNTLELALVQQLKDGAAASSEQLGGSLDAVEQWFSDGGFHGGASLGVQQVFPRVTRDCAVRLRVDAFLVAFVDACLSILVAVD